MSSSDIEDVLSSIRRLVTGDLRPRTAETSTESVDVEVPQTAPDPAGKLLLTPALRVVPPAAAEASRPPVDGVLSVIGANVAPPPTGFESETGDAFSAATETVPPRPVAAVTAAPRALADTFVFTAPKDRALVEPSVAEEPEEIEADEATVPPATPERRLHVRKTDEDDVDDDEDILPEEVSPVVDLDEETLRELIRDVLREELQGPMGERITRNIRKLVRAELARAISFRNLG